MVGQSGLAVVNVGNDSEIDYFCHGGIYHYSIFLYNAYSMKIIVTAKTGAKDERVEQVAENSYQVAVKARPIKGKATLQA
jgi:hypothetical protein